MAAGDDDERRRVAATPARNFGGVAARFGWGSEGEMERRRRAIRGRKRGIHSGEETAEFKAGLIRENGHGGFFSGLMMMTSADVINFFSFSFSEIFFNS